VLQSDSMISTETYSASLQDLTRSQKGHSTIIGHCSGVGLPKTSAQQHRMMLLHRHKKCMLQPTFENLSQLIALKSDALAFVFGLRDVQQDQ